jgi:hypothetical protein
MMKNEKYIKIKTVLIKMKIEMKIERIGQELFLIKEDSKEVNITDGQIIQYSGIYYKKMVDDEIYNKAEIETTFIGKVECNKYHHETGYQGIYVMPLYIWSIIQYKWLKIINLEYPKPKYFLYPHLLLLPEINCNYKSIYKLHTCDNRKLEDFAYVTDTIELQLPNY